MTVLFQEARDLAKNFSLKPNRDVTSFLAMTEEEIASSLNQAPEEVIIFDVKAIAGSEEEQKLRRGADLANKEVVFLEDLDLSDVQFAIMDDLEAEGSPFWHFSRFVLKMGPEVIKYQQSAYINDHDGSKGARHPSQGHHLTSNLYMEAGEERQQRAISFLQSAPEDIVESLRAILLDPSTPRHSHYNDEETILGFLANLYSHFVRGARYWFCDPAGTAQSTDVCRVAVGWFIGFAIMDHVA